ncbi:MAG: MarR family winged helix-turn-helix transcriptional regulator [Acetobacteraceae bacterium]
MDRDDAEPADTTLYDGLAGFRSALRRFLAFSESVTRAAGVTSWQYQALLVIRCHPGPGITIGNLATEMLLQHHGAVQLVDRLVRAGLAERQASPTDRRSVLVTLTERGTSLLEGLAAEHLSELLRQEPLLAESLRRLREIDR